jgi:hypothetical protein
MGISRLEALMLLAAGLALWCVPGVLAETLRDLEKRRFGTEHIIVCAILGTFVTLVVSLVLLRRG